MKCPALLLPLCLALQACSGLQPPVFPVASSIAATTTPQNEEVVFIGDSITVIWAEQSAFQAHENWINQSITGQNSNLIARRYQHDVIDLHPGTVHILMGTNDVYPGWMLCNTKAPDRATATTPPGLDSLNDSPDTCANVYYMLETAKRNKIKVIIGTIPPWGCADDAFCGLSTADKTFERYNRIFLLNEWLKKFAVEEGATVVDYHTALTNKEGLHYAEGLTSDGVHPNAEGYTVMQPLVEPTLK